MHELILIIEDSAPIAAILARHVASAGYRTAVANDGAEGLALVARTPPACILLDLMMPGKNGAEVLCELRGNPATTAIPVVLVSAQVGDGNGPVGVPLDVEGSVGKPFTRDHVVGAVRAALRKRPPTP
jgi:two-component system phosphate regulon response regulator PhoB